MSNITAITPFRLTEAGHELQLKVEAGLCKLNLCGVVIGDGYLTEGQSIESLTALVSPIETTDGTAVSSPLPVATLSEVFKTTDAAGKSTCLVHLLIKNGNNPDTRIREVGILAMDNNTPIIYGALNFGDSAYPFPTYDGQTPVIYDWKFNLYVSNVASVTSTIEFVAGVAREEFRAHVNDLANPHEVTAEQAGAIPASEKGSAGGVAELDASGKVPSGQLPSYVDDVLEYTNRSAFPATGESGKIYVDQDTEKTYRWGGTDYVEISASLALGETSSTAYRGDRGAAAYSHSQQPHAPSNANYYVHPSSHSAAMINETNDRQFVSAAEKSDWNQSIMDIADIFTDIATLQRKVTALETGLDYVDLSVNITKTTKSSDQSSFNITSANGTWDAAGYAANVVIESTPMADEFDGIMYIYASAINRTVTVGLNVSNSTSGKVYATATSSGTYTLRVYNTVS